MSKRWNNFKDMHKELSDEKNSISSLEREKKELESNPYVQRYLDIIYLLQIQQTITSVKLTDYVNEQSTNDIYVFKSSYAVYKDNHSNTQYYIVSYGDSKEVYREYKNLETGQIVCVDKDDFEIFESSHVILHATGRTFYDYYKEAQRIYYSELNRNGEKRAREKIKRL